MYFLASNNKLETYGTKTSRRIGRRQVTQDVSAVLL